MYQKLSIFSFHYYDEGRRTTFVCGMQIGSESTSQTEVSKFQALSQSLVSVTTYTTWGLMQSSLEPEIIFQGTLSTHNTITEPMY